MPSSRGLELRYQLHVAHQSRIRNLSVPKLFMFVLQVLFALNYVHCRLSRILFRANSSVILCVSNLMKYFGALLMIPSINFKGHLHFHSCRMCNSSRFATFLTRCILYEGQDWVILFILLINQRQRVNGYPQQRCTIASSEVKGSVADVVGGCTV